MTRAGAVEGTGAAARFNGPFGVATDGAGNVYVSDRDNNTIRKITPAGLVTTLAGTASVTGSTDGAGAAASFDYPSGIATDGAGNVYVADYGNRTIRKITPAGVVTTLAGRAGARGSNDGVGAAARFDGPLAVATDGAGNLYVADLFSTVRKITPDGMVTTFAGRRDVTGTIDGAGAAARFGFLRGIATDSAGNVYVTDHDNQTIRKITPAGVVTTLAGSAGVEGNANGPGAEARFSFPLGIAVDSAGNIYVAENFGLPDNPGLAGKLAHTIRKITPAGIVSTVVGVAGRQGFVPGALPGGLEAPAGVAVGGTSLYITLNNDRNGRSVGGAVAVVRNRP
jgi:sugar lactone lactonase YvrE